jgi:hypothetical protein
LPVGESLKPYGSDSTWNGKFFGERVNSLGRLLVILTSKSNVRRYNVLEPEEDSFAEGIIKGLQDFKEGRITRFKDAE